MKKVLALVAIVFVVACQALGIRQLELEMRVSGGDAGISDAGAE